MVFASVDLVSVRSGPGSGIAARITRPRRVEAGSDTTSPYLHTLFTLISRVLSRTIAVSFCPTLRCALRSARHRIGIGEGRSEIAVVVGHIVPRNRLGGKEREGQTEIRGLNGEFIVIDALRGRPVL